MAVILSMTYQKKLGLPNFSSHSCQVSLTVEIPDVSQAAQESAKLYQLLQAAVDQEIQQVGFMPDATVYGMNKQENGSNGHTSNGHRPPSRSADDWNCTEGQKGFIIRIVNESRLEKAEVEQMSQQLFNAGVKQLDRLQASQLIEELLEKTGKKVSRGSRWRKEPART